MALTGGLSELVRTITFVPDSTTDVPLYVQVHGTYSATGVSGIPVLEIIVKDSAGSLITEYQLALSVSELTMGTGEPYWFQTHISGFNGKTISVFPDASYTIEFKVGGVIGQIDTTNFKIFVAPTFTEEVPSDNVTG